MVMRKKSLRNTNIHAEKNVSEVDEVRYAKHELQEFSDVIRGDQLDVSLPSEN